ncbi:Mu-like prophage major head subunit gpT family protein [Leptospira sp. 96542]|nr:Mu-like prophage major head subunit gpT family protein [Leptospira sp. 96542]
MSAQDLSSRAVIGMYYEALEAQAGMGWIDAVSNLFNSDQSSETYKWLGMPPAMREWIGGRNAKGFTTNGITIANKHFESTIEIAIPDLRRDKSPQLRARMAELAERGNTHFASLLSTLIVNGEATPCYDGQYFFDTDHSEGDSGTQSNDITTDISGLPATVRGSVTAPSPEEMQQAILASISQMYTFKDDKGEPLNEMANSFIVLVPVGLSTATMSALSMVRAAAASTFAIENFTVRAAVNPRLTSAGWTDKFVTMRTDGSIKPLIRQTETENELKVKDENSEFAFDNDAIQVGLDAWRNVGYGRWQGAVLNTLV